MRSHRTITYATHPEGFTISRVNDLIAWPILDFNQIGKGGTDDNGISYAVGDFRGPMIYKFETIKLHSVVLHHEWQSLTWTRKLPISEKNKHRAFWGMKPLKFRDAGIGDPEFQKLAEKPYPNYVYEKDRKP